MNKREESKIEIKRCCDKLKELIKEPNTTIYTCDKGKNRVRVYFVNDENKLQDITYYVGRAYKLRLNPLGVLITGTGFDKGHDIVDSLQSSLNMRLTNEKI